MSNFTEPHLRDLMGVAEVKPAVNQVREKEREGEREGRKEGGSVCQ